MRAFETGEVFFTEYSEFLQTHGVRREWNRLTKRYDVLFGRNRQLFSGARVLDLGSHDGRWSMAALTLGAAHVTGLERDPLYLADAARIFEQRGVLKSQYRFIPSYIPSSLEALETGQFDIILCLGFYYHTPHHMRIFEEFYRLKPNHIILDTAVSKWPLMPIVQYRQYDKTRTHSVSGPGLKAGETVMVGKPNHEFIRMLADTFKMQLTELNWKDGSIKDWTSLRSYRSRGRRSYLFSRT